MTKEDKIFREAVDGYGFEEIPQTGEGLFCNGCLCVHKRPNKMYQSQCAPKQKFCKYQVAKLFNVQRNNMEINGKEVTKDNLYEECVERGIPVHNHYSDLYIPVTAETTALYKYFKEKLGKFFTSPTPFVNQVEGGLWYDFPFQYIPYWEEKQKLANKFTELGKS